jgi:hypothetical protein
MARQFVEGIYVTPPVASTQRLTPTVRMLGLPRGAEGREPGCCPGWGSRYDYSSDDAQNSRSKANTYFWRK